MEIYPCFLEQIWIWLLLRSAGVKLQGCQSKTKAQDLWKIDILEVEYNSRDEIRR